MREHGFEYPPWGPGGQGLNSTERRPRSWDAVAMAFPLHFLRCSARTIKNLVKPRPAKGIQQLPWEWFLLEWLGMQRRPGLSQTESSCNCSGIGHLAGCVCMCVCVWGGAFLWVLLLLWGLELPTIFPSPCTTKAQLINCLNSLYSRKIRRVALDVPALLLPYCCK